MIDNEKELLNKFSNWISTKDIINTAHFEIEIPAFKAGYAAPEMLDALIIIVKLHTLPDKTKEIDIAIEAIEKATGKPIDEVVK